MQEQKAKRQRSCITCGKKDDKVSLYRVVRLQDGSVKYDATGRTSGRGAYVCSTECLHRAIEAHKFDRALRTKIDRNDAERIAAEIDSAANSVSER